MRRRILISLLTALLLGALSQPIPLAADGRIIVKMTEAIANMKGEDDKPFGPEQDFYAINGIDFGPPHFTRVIDGRDYASWVPPEVNVKVVPGMNQRYFDLYFELWDLDPHDFGNVDDGFDISPQNGPPGPPAPGGIYVPNVVTGSNPHVDYDVCTGEMLVKGVNGSGWIPIGTDHANLKGIPTSPGIPRTWATLRFSVEADPPNWLPEDIKVGNVQIIQSIYEQDRAVADKETSLSVKVYSTYPMRIQAPLIGQMDDGITPVNDSKLVWIEPGENHYFLFDPPRAQAFRPFKPTVIPGPGTGVVHGWARIDYNETVSPNAPLELQDCANINNTGKATDLPLVRVSDLHTVFAPFDYDEDMSFMTSGQLQALFNRDETFRLAAWPLASLDHAASFNQLHRNHGSDILCPFEPFCTVIKYSIGASQAGIDRLILSVRNQWFADNAFRHQFIGGGSIGYSLGWFARHAVLAEDGYNGVSTHELGHTNDLSQHPCSNGGITGNCADEYAHPHSDGSPYPATGYDVHGDVDPNGIYLGSWRNFSLGCPATTPIPHDVCAVNIMDSNPPISWGFTNWVDSLTFHWLMDYLPHIDPMLINVSGYIHLPGGFGDPNTPAAVEGAMPFFSYQHMGNQDMPEAPVSDMGERFSGFGAFWIRFVTSGGVRDYRFNPRFFDNAPLPDMAGAFSLDLPWDPFTTRIQLFGLTELASGDCQNVLCAGSYVLLAERMVSARAPSVSDLRAGLDTPAPPPPPGGVPPVVIGPGHDAVLTWATTDSDSSEVRSLILVMRQDSAGGPGGQPMPVAIDISGNTLRIPHDRLIDESGTYIVRAAASDGVNSTEVASGPLFTICNYTNGGVEVCNGVDDDCDGTVDNGVQPGPTQNVTLNPQPFPPAPPVLQWPADPQAQSYDVVYGDLATLRGTGGDFSRAILGCVAENTVGTSVSINPGPQQGQAFFYLVRGNNCIGTGTWNESQPGPTQLDRDPGINASPASCRP